MVESSESKPRLTMVKASAQRFVLTMGNWDPADLYVLLKQGMAKKKPLKSLRQAEASLARLGVDFNPLPARFGQILPPGVKGLMAKPDQFGILAISNDFALIQGVRIARECLWGCYWIPERMVVYDEWRGK